MEKTPPTRIHRPKPSATWFLDSRAMYFKEPHGKYTIRRYTDLRYGEMVVLEGDKERIHMHLSTAQALVGLLYSAVNWTDEGEVNSDGEGTESAAQG